MLFFASKGGQMKSKDERNKQVSCARHMRFTNVLIMRDTIRTSTHYWHNMKDCGGPSWHMTADSATHLGSRWPGLSGMSSSSSSPRTICRALVRPCRRLCERARLMSRNSRMKNTCATGSCSAAAAAATTTASPTTHLPRRPRPICIRQPAPPAAGEPEEKIKEKIQ